MTLIKFFLLRFAWTLLAPFAAVVAFVGLSWLIDWFDRIGALDR